jgi:3'-5' exoribonuclease
MEHIWIKDIKENDTVNGDYLVTNKTLGQTRQGNAFLTLTLADKTGAIEARVWDNVEQLSSQFKERDVVTVVGQANTYRNQIQIQIQGLKRNPSPVDTRVFLDSTPQDTGHMLSELKKLTHQIENKHLKTLIDSFMADHRFVSEFKKAPAAKYFHHAYLGGLLEHTLSVARIAFEMSEHYPDLDKDLLLAGAVLHDIGKMQELTYDLGIEYSDRGRLLGHIVLGVLMVEEKLQTLKDFPPELATRLKHLILSHHGEFEFGSPKRPKFLEAFALHLIDDLDAKMIGLSKLLKNDRQEGSWTAFNQLFQRYFFKGSPTAEAEKKREGISTKESDQPYLFPVDL